MPAWAPEPWPEVGWRLTRSAWGHGYATEAGHEALHFAFEDQRFEQVVSYTTIGNLRSRRVMERLGLVRDPAADFEYPLLPAGHPLRPHVTYRLTRATWIAGGAAAGGGTAVGDAPGAGRVADDRGRA